MTAAPGPRHVPDGALPASAIVAAALFLGIALDPSTRIGLVGSIGRPLRPTIAVGIIMFGLWIVVRALRAARNTHFGLLPPLAPIAPPPDLSSDNVYAQSRNPLYLGLGVLGFGIAVFLGSDCATLLLIPAALVIHFGLVRREERQFEQAFGDDYRRYEARVPRYGLPLPRRSPDCARVIAPAPVIAFATLLAGLALDELARPSNGIDSLPGAITIPIAIGVFVTGASILARAIGAFQRVDTHVFPHLPSRALALDGIYCQTRNPMYQAMGVFVLGFALVLRSDWTLLLLIPAALFVHYGIVIREERYLEQKFGDAYRRYRNDVPRYGLPLLVSRHAPGGSSEDGD